MREETVADVQAMIEGRAWGVAWQTTHLMNATGNFPTPLEVDQIQRRFMQDLFAAESAPETEVSTDIDPDKADRMRARLQEAAMRRGLTSRPEIVDETPTEPPP